MPAPGGLKAVKLGGVSDEYLLAQPRVGDPARRQVAEFVIQLGSDESIGYFLNQSAMKSIRHRTFRAV